MSKLATLTLKIEIVTIGDYFIAEEIASEMLGKLIKTQQALSSDYGYAIVRDATIVDGEETGYLELPITGGDEVVA